MAYFFDPTVPLGTPVPDSLITPALTGIPAGDFAMLMVFRRARNIGGSSEYLFSRGNLGSQNSVGARWNSAGLQVLPRDAAGNQIDVQGGSPVIGQWHVGIVNFDYATLTARLYLDGLEVDSATVTAWGGVDGYPTYIGATGSSSASPLQGDIADLCQWSRQLTPQEIANLSDLDSGVRARHLNDGLDWLYEMDSLDNHLGTGTMTVHSGTPTLVPGPYSTEPAIVAQYVHRVAQGAPAPTDATTRISGDIGTEVRTYQDTTAARGQSYDYYVEAVYEGDVSVFSSPITVSIPWLPPQASVIQPVAGTVSEGMMLPLIGTAAPGSGAIVVRRWSSSVDGVLGTGNELYLVLSGTDDAPVTHVLTFYVEDDNGQNDSVPVVVTIGLGEGGGTGGFDAARFAIQAMGGV